MPRPTMDVNGPEYQAILRGRDMYRRYGMNYKDVMWAEDTLDRLEKKLPYDDYTEKDQADFLKAQEIYARVFARKTSEETAENHSTARYIWRTRGDGKVRPEHAANDGKIFAWDNPPPTGNPGEAFGCRCWAEPYKEDTGELQEHSSQVVTFAMPDVLPPWGNAELAAHYMAGTGKDLTLHEIGLLQEVIEYARTRDQAAAGGGSLFKRVEQQIFSEARQKGAGTFTTTFDRGTYDFSGVVWAFGHVPVHGEVDVHVIEKNGFLIITAEIYYHFEDYFRIESLNGEREGEGTIHPQDRNISVIGTKAFYIRDTWSTKLDAIVKKDS